MAKVFEFDRALVRRPARTASMGLRAVDRGSPDVPGLEREHAAYVAALEAAGVAVEVLPPLEGFPDSLFIEDPALVFAEGAVVLRPGAPSRAGEAKALVPDLQARFGTVLTLPAPGMVDGGDVLVLPEVVVIGLSARTDTTGAADLVGCLERLGRRARVVRPPAGVLHLKTACTLLDETTLLATRPIADAHLLSGWAVLTVPEGEEPAANALRVNGHVLIPAGFPKTAAMLRAAGYEVVELPAEEVRKLDAGLTCLSLRWKTA
ncbi:dimethylarginine dimethylaminohydrolase family protein [Methylobrevis pamukkalensis]|uniref:N(G),N(G)-dimethylarginine dimethylaminohydrolase n=1 Tax=Methylobrevis pamukkalensis TaxID=1439726 RepID=A0A1E3H0K0_9HYPH|nr:arginine deiminase family protein [Methylobrevis pamukkalensis]ODN69853.1 N(G),N(G)-dimethylarginine dimethylaminohydrolase [Methylobrevis pamukkalensis]